jgi:hypothetical protein
MGVAARAGRREPIAGDARLVVHDRDVAAGESIKESRLSDIRPPDNGNLAREILNVCAVHR